MVLWVWPEREPERECEGVCEFVTETARNGTEASCCPAMGHLAERPTRSCPLSSASLTSFVVVVSALLLAVVAKTKP